MIVWVTSMVTIGMESVTRRERILDLAVASGLITTKTHFKKRGMGILPLSSVERQDRKQNFGFSVATIWKTSLNARPSQAWVASLNTGISFSSCAYLPNACGITVQKSAKESSEGRQKTYYKPLKNLRRLSTAWRYFWGRLQQQVYSKAIILLSWAKTGRERIAK